jgi:hypothetical protein
MLKTFLKVLMTVANHELWVKGSKGGNNLDSEACSLGFWSLDGKAKKTWQVQVAVDPGLAAAPRNLKSPFQVTWPNAAPAFILETSVSTALGHGTGEEI